MKYLIILLFPFSLMAETLCEIKEINGGAVVGKYFAESCDIKKYGGKLGDGKYVVHEENNVLYSVYKVQEQADLDAMAQKKARISLLKQAIKDANADADFTNAEIKQLLRAIVKLLKEDM